MVEKVSLFPKNNRKNTWKAILAAVLVMAGLFAMSSLVNAGIVELILGEEYEAVATASSSSEDSNECKHPLRLELVEECSKCGIQYIKRKACVDCGREFAVAPHTCIYY